MLTPSFEIKQDEDFLLILIKCPFAKISETEIFINNDEFKFYSKPYFLRLSLPGNIIEDGKEKATYDADSGSFIIKVPKETPGEVFEGLDMLGKLLASKGNMGASGPNIEVVSPNFQNDEIEDEIDWEIDQIPYVEEITIEGFKYGFGNQRNGILGRIQQEFHEVVDVHDPDSMSPIERRRQRITQENEKFDDEYYLSNLYEEDECLQNILLFTTTWQNNFSKTNTEYQIGLTDEEREVLLKLPVKEYLIDKNSQPSLLLSLVDIIFAYAYNYRTTEGENNVESAWTICKLSGTLSWLETYTSLESMVISCMRRSLCFPLYRSWKLSKKVLNDTQVIFSQGKTCLLKCLLDIRQILMKSEPFYILNELYIVDYCIWIQSIKEKHIKSLAEALSKVQIQKVDVGLDLIILEKAAEMVKEENSSISESSDSGSYTPDSSTDSESGDSFSLSKMKNLSIGHKEDELNHDESSDSDSVKELVLPFQATGRKLITVIDEDNTDKKECSHSSALLSLEDCQNGAPNQDIMSVVKKITNLRLEKDYESDNETDCVLEKEHEPKNCGIEIIN